jgi:hypothetical protein
VNCAAAQFILRTGSLGSKGSGQLQPGAFAFAVVIAKNTAKTSD